jgi:hypothetical protein
MLEVMEPALKEYQKMISEREAAEPKAMEIPNGIVEMQSMEQYSRYIKSSQPLLLKVHGQHCINCKGQELLTALATIGLETPILSIDGDAFPDLCASLKVTQYPTFIACREGYRYGLQTGYSTGSAETQLRALLARARKP